MSSKGFEIKTHKGRRRARLYHYWIDHEFLRGAWTNFHEIAPGAYRSNHPTRKRFEAYAAMGIKSILTMRGAEDQPHYMFEVEACRDLGLEFYCVPMSARHAPIIPRLRQTFEIFDKIEYPFLMHCKSGADRTGLVAALYLMEYHGVPIDQARKQLSFRYKHIRRSATGILDFFLDTYEARFRETGIGVREWVRKEYKPAEFKAAYAEYKKSLRLWQGWR